MTIKYLANHSSNLIQAGTQRISANWKDHKVAMICGLAVTVLSAGAGLSAVGVGLALSPLGISSLLVSGIALGLLMQVSFKKPQNSHPFDAKLIPSNQISQPQIENAKETIVDQSAKPQEVAPQQALESQQITTSLLNEAQNITNLTNSLLEEIFANALANQTQVEEPIQTIVNQSTESQNTSVLSSIESFEEVIEILKILTKSLTEPAQQAITNQAIRAISSLQDGFSYITTAFNKKDITLEARKEQILQWRSSSLPVANQQELTISNIEKNYKEAQEILERVENLLNEIEQQTIKSQARRAISKLQDGLSYITTAFNKKEITQEEATSKNPKLEARKEQILQWRSSSLPTQQTIADQSTKQDSRRPRTGHNGRRKDRKEAYQLIDNNKDSPNETINNKKSSLSNWKEILPSMPTLSDIKARLPSIPTVPDIKINLPSLSNEKPRLPNIDIGLSPTIYITTQQLKEPHKDILPSNNKEEQIPSHWKLNLSNTSTLAERVISPIIFDAEDIYSSLPTIQEQIEIETEDQKTSANRNPSISPALTTSDQVIASSPSPSIRPIRKAKLRKELKKQKEQNSNPQASIEAPTSSQKSSPNKQTKKTKRETHTLAMTVCVLAAMSLTAYNNNR